VGLNSAEAAVQPISVDTLETFAPDIVMFHQSATLDLSDKDRSSAVAPIKEIGHRITPSSKELFGKEFGSFENIKIAASLLAALVLDEFLDKHLADYDVFAVDAREDGTWDHVWAFRKGFDKREALRLLAEARNSKARISYLDAGKRVSP
jgi:hypothetical protein